MQKGWEEYNEKWYYLDSNGKMVTGTQTIDYKEYYFYSDDGEMATGWMKESNNTWDYFDQSTGERETGWINDNGKYYYLNSNGGYKTGWQYIDGTWYYFYSEGEMQTGWIEDSEGKWYYYDPSSGESKTGWIKDSNGKWYYLKSNRTLRTGWMQDGDKKYYLNSEGEMQTGWVEDNGNWYYFNSKGEMQTGTVNIDGNDYEFNDSGELERESTTPGTGADPSVSGDSLVSDDLIKFIAGYELFKPYAYEDPYYPGVQEDWTIGYGTTYGANSSAFPNGLSSTCTEPQAEEWLKEEVNKVAVRIKSALDAQGVTVSQQAFDCLCDIGYNAGTGDLIGGNTWNAVISGDSDRITNALMSWNKANGRISDGLTARCKARVNMCLNGVYDSTH